MADLSAPCRGGFASCGMRRCPIRARPTERFLSRNVVAVDGKEVHKRFSEFDALKARLIASGFPTAKDARLPSKIKKNVAKRSIALPAFLDALLDAVGDRLETEPSAAPLRDFLGRSLLGGFDKDDMQRVAKSGLEKCCAPTILSLPIAPRTLGTHHRSNLPASQA
eukprot:SAG11_NODE_6362_length_1328_cov_4.543531_1_plen_166_part_00